jgi:peptide/nickel transport system permease protein
MHVLRIFARDKAAVVGLVIVLFAIFLGIAGPYVVPYPDDAFETNIMSRLEAPSAEHWFGTDDFGRDIFSRVILGTGNALTVAVGVAAAAILVGVPLGMWAGYYGRWRGEAVMRVTDVFLAVPSLILAIALAQLLHAGISGAILALSLTYWPHFCRNVYAETRSAKNSVYVEALESVGAHPQRIIFLHILPNIASSIIVRATVGLGYIIMTSAVLGFLGIGVPPPAPDWGAAIANSREHLPDSWWLVSFPGLAIFLTVLGFNLLGDGLRDIIDPRLRRSR